MTGIVYGLFIAQLFTAVYTKADHIRSYFVREISLLNDLMLSCSLWSACNDADKLEVLLLIRNYALSIAREVKLDVIDEEEEANQGTNSSISGRQSHAQQAERAAADIEDLYGVLALLTTATGSGEGKVEVSSSPSSPPPPPLLLAVQPQQIAATLTELAGAKLQRLSLMRCCILSFNTSLALLIMTGFMYCKITIQKEAVRNHLFFFPCRHLVLTIFRCHNFPPFPPRNRWDYSAGDERAHDQHADLLPGFFVNLPLLLWPFADGSPFRGCDQIYLHCGSQGAVAAPRAEGSRAATECAAAREHNPEEEGTSSSGTVEAAGEQHRTEEPTRRSSK